MKTLTSTEFRKRYAALDEPTEVTVLGRLIGTWFPVGISPQAHVDFGEPDKMYRPISPAPKPGKKR